MKKYLRFNSVFILLLSLCILLFACEGISTVSENDTTSELVDESVVTSELIDGNGMTSESSEPDKESDEKPILGADGGDFTIGEIMDALEYNVDDVMKFEGNTAEEPLVKTSVGFDKNNNYSVFTRTHQCVESNFYPVITDNNVNVIYPGALVLANNKVIDGVPQDLDVKRGNSTLYLNFADDSEQATVEVTEANASNTQSALNSALEDWYTSIGGTYISGGHYGMSYTKTPVYDAKMLQLALGIDEAFATNTLGIEFDEIRINRYCYYVIEFKEIMYVASAAPFNSPEDAFDASVTSSELLNGGVNNANPPAYVSMVEYGRRIYMVLKSTKSICELTNFVNEAVNEYGLLINEDLTSRYNEIINNTTISIIDTANANNHQSDIPLSSDTKIGKLEIAEYSTSDPAAPLDYSLVMLKDNADATPSGSTEYISQSYEFFTACNIHLKHDGAYIAEFIVSWDEITGYNDYGNPIIEHVEWDRNKKHCLAGYETTIALGGNCRNINIEARGATGLVWEKWRTSFKKENLPLVPDYYLEISGTSLRQKANFESK